MKSEPQSNLELNHLVPTVASDGHGVFISNDGDIPTLTFFQIRSQAADHVHADVVASVRMSTLDDLKKLQQSIEETIRNHLSRED